MFPFSKFTMPKLKNIFPIDVVRISFLITVIVCIFTTPVSTARGLDEPSPVWLIGVEISCPKLFTQIDSIISNTDLTITVKPERASLICPSKYINIFEPRIVSGEGKPWNETVFWLKLYSMEEDDYSYDRYFFKIGDHIYTSSDWLPTLYTRKNNKKMYLGKKHLTLYYFDPSPLWLFKIEYGKITQAIYHVSELDDFQEPGYDLLNHMIISEGIMEIEPTK